MFLFFFLGCFVMIVRWKCSRDEIPCLRLDIFNSGYFAHLWTGKRSACCVNKRVRRSLTPRTASGYWSGW